MIGETASTLSPDAKDALLGLPLLSVDVESNPADGNRIFLIGAVRNVDSRSLSLSVNRTTASGVGRQLDELARGARYLVGHNLRRHDLPALRHQYPGLSSIRLPVVDTLELSAIAFPNNPYHRLVKGYKLVSDARNEPLRDAESLGIHHQGFADCDAG